MAIPQKDIKLLWGRAASRCSICGATLSQDKNASEDKLLIGEQAHMIAEDPDGPRGISALSKDERNTYPNLILLCANCHTEIDKDPGNYPVEKLYMLKYHHETRVQDKLASIDKRAQGDVISLDDLVQFSSLLRPIVFWIHRVVPRERSKEYFQALQDFWVTSNAATDHVPDELTTAIDYLLRPLAAENNIFYGGTHYAESNFVSSGLLFTRHFRQKGLEVLRMDKEVEFNVAFAVYSSNCEYILKQSAFLTENEIEIVRLVALIIRYYEQHIKHRGHREITEHLTDQFFKVISPFLSNRLGVEIPDKLNDRAIDRIQNFTKK